ncbi:MAG: hypothetical protein Ct9H90mP9_0850 [Pseudomonadota bacterium]|nr:MAG: hypothetical protein Ct9H90mP9_0850 [Pseudomonadota bacterium]
MPKMGIREKTMATKPRVNAKGTPIRINQSWSGFLHQADQELPPDHPLRPTSSLLAKPRNAADTHRNQRTINGECGGSTRMKPATMKVKKKGPRPTLRFLPPFFVPDRGIRSCLPSAFQWLCW